MEQEEQKHLEEREEAKEKLDDLNEQLKDVNMDKKKRAELEEEARRLETVINMFDSAFTIETFHLKVQIMQKHKKISFIL